MTCSFRTRLACVVVLAVMTGSCANPSHSTTIVPPEVLEVLRWLPDDTESVITSRPSSSVPPSEASLEADPRVIRRLEYMPLLLLYSVGGGDIASTLEGQRIAIAIQGARKFRAPAYLEMGTFEGCSIVLFEQSLARFRQDIRAIGLMRGTPTSIEGVDAFMFDESTKHTTRHCYVAVPRDDVLLCGSDRDYVSTVIQRMKAGTARPSVIERGAEWKSIDAGAPFWCLRHYARPAAPEDITSPHAAPGGGSVPRDADAVGLACSVHRDASDVVVVHMSASPERLKVAKAVWGSQDLAAEYREGEGIVEVGVKANSARAAFNLWFVLLTLLGQAVAV